MNVIKKLFGFMDKIIVITVKLLCGDHPEPNKEAVSYTHLTLPTICSV